MVMSMAVVDAVAVSGALLAARRLVGRAYSSEEEVVSFVAALVPLLCITVVTDAMQGVLAGIFSCIHRSLARAQHRTAADCRTLLAHS
jgi:MATE family multidrug resistance protein